MGSLALGPRAGEVEEEEEEEDYRKSVTSTHLKILLHVPHL